MDTRSVLAPLYLLERFDMGVVHLDDARRVVGMNDFARRVLPVDQMQPFDRMVLSFHPERSKPRWGKTARRRAVTPLPLGRPSSSGLPASEKCLARLGALTLAGRAGITVAETRVIRLSDAHAIAIRRFDRSTSGRIHSLSAGTAIRAATPSGTEPNLGYPELARLLRRVGVTQDGANRRDARELFRRMVFNILIDNTDDHEKNHALLVANPQANGRLKLAPAYDGLPTNAGQERAQRSVSLISRAGHSAQQHPRQQPHWRA